MGQKTHPNGLRLGLHRKWASSWFTTSTASINKNKLSPYLIARGGTVQSGIEAFIINRRIRRTVPLSLKSKFIEDSQASTRTSESPLQSKIWSTHRFFPVNIQIVKGSIGSLYIVFFYVKLFGRDSTQLWPCNNQRFS